MNRLFDMMKEFAEPKENLEECCHEFIPTPHWDECRHCHQIQTQFIVSVDAPTYSTFINLKYQPLTHFKSRMYQLQGKENKEIPSEILDLCRECKDYRDVLTILKSNKKPTFYKHKCKILNEIGRPVPCLSVHEEQQVIDIFKLRFPMKQNKNSISYQFILYRILSLIKREDLHPFIELTKNKSKLKRYDSIFKV